MLIWVSVAGAGVAAPGAADPAAARRGAVLGARAAARVRGPVPRGHGLQPGDRPGPGDRARHARDRALRGQGHARFVSTVGDPAERDPDAVRALRGARLRPADHPPLRPALAPGGLAGVAQRGGRPARHSARAARGDPARAPHAAPPRRHAHPARHHRPGRRPAVPAHRSLSAARRGRPQPGLLGARRARLPARRRPSARVGRAGASGWSRTATPRSPRSRGRTSTRAARPSPSGRVAGVPDASGAPAAAGGGGARIVRYEDERVVVPRPRGPSRACSSSATPGSPGWKAKVDGADAHGGAGGLRAPRRAGRPGRAHGFAPLRAGELDAWAGSSARSRSPASSSRSC